MAEIILTQSEADALIAMEKIRISDENWNYPSPGNSIRIPLRSPDKREEFFLDLYRGRIDLNKVIHQNRARHTVVLVRLDLLGAPHVNPDGEEISGPHLHIYREGFGDKWAFPIPPDKFSDLKDLSKVLEDFMRFCNISNPPLIQMRLAI